MTRTQSRCSIWNWGPIHPFSHFQNRFPEAMNDRGDASKMFRNLAVQLCNSRTRAVSIIEALSTLAVLAVRAVPKSAGYREIWWNNFMAHLTGWVTCGLINLRFGEVQVPRKQSCNSPASQRFTFWIQLSAQACRQSDKLLPSEGLRVARGARKKRAASLGLRWDSFPTSFLHFSRLAGVGSFSEAKKQHEPTC